MGTVEETQTDVDRLAELERKQAELAAEIERLRSNDPVKKAEALLMRSPVPTSARVREQVARQDAARIASVRAAEAVAEEALTWATAHAPEVAKHEGKLAELDARIAKARDAFEAAGRKLVELERERIRLVGEAPRFVSPSSDRPIWVDPRPDKRRWRG
jgi:hypothetical protein